MLMAFCLCLFRFIGYPGNYNTLFGVRNEDVSHIVVLKDNLNPERTVKEKVTVSHC